MTSKTIVYIRNMLLENLEKAAAEDKQAWEAVRAVRRLPAEEWDNDNLNELHLAAIEANNKWVDASKAFEEFEEQQW